MKRLLFFTLIFLSLPLTVFTQTQLQEMGRISCQDCVIVRSYNSATNRSVLWLKMLKIADAPEGDITLSLSREMGESPPDKPKTLCTVSIAVIGNAPYDTKDLDIIFLADGKPINFGKAALGGSSQLKSKTTPAPSCR